jgi:hypothetical protein
VKVEKRAVTLHVSACLKLLNFKMVVIPITAILKDLENFKRVSCDVFTFVTILIMTLLMRFFGL